MVILEYVGSNSSISNIRKLHNIGDLLVHVTKDNMLALDTLVKIRRRKSLLLRKDVWKVVKVIHEPIKSFGKVCYTMILKQQCRQNLYD